MSGAGATDCVSGGGEGCVRSELVLENGPEALSAATDFLERFSEAVSLPPHVVRAVDLALTEWITNIISYGFAAGERGTIRVSLILKPPEIEVEVEDTGCEFNPLERAAVDTTKPLAQKPIGGLGIHLVRQVMDQLTYRRADGKNRLNMVKRIAAVG